jgi:hypothetical protein
LLCNPRYQVFVRRARCLVAGMGMRQCADTGIGQLRISAHRGRHFRLIVDGISA